jgi:hypothetical protein
MRIHNANAAAAALFTVCVFSSVASGIEYQFTRIALTGAEVHLLQGQEPELNDQGGALFTGRFADDVEALLIGDGGPFDLITAWTGAPRFGITANAIGEQQMNEVGDVVFRGQPPGVGDRRIFLWPNGEPLKELYTTTGGPNNTFRFSSEPSINDRGDVVFVGSGQSLLEAVFVGDRNGTLPVTALAAADGPLAEGFSNFAAPRITNDGTVILVATKNSALGIHKLTGPGMSVPIAEIGRGFNAISQPDANNHGIAAFIGETSDGIGGVFVGDENGLARVATATTTLRFINEPGINDQGDVVFRGQLNTGNDVRDILMTGPDPVADKLIAEGDLLFGAPVIELIAGRGSINDVGQIAFFAQRALPSGNTDSGIYVATPIPEPQTLALAFSGLLIAALLRRPLVAQTRRQVAAGSG